MSDEGANPTPDQSNSSQATPLLQGSTSRRWYLIAAVAVGLSCLILAIALPLTLTSRNEGSSKEEVSSEPILPIPTSFPEHKPPLESLLANFPNQTKASLQKPYSPQTLAIQWLSNHPEISNLPEWRKLQLFVLLTVYYGFDGPNWPNQTRHLWLDVSRHECDWLQDSQTSEKHGEQWYQELAPCLNESVVQNLVMSGLASNLTEWNLPPELGLLPGLVSLELFNNGIDQSLGDFGVLLLIQIEALQLAQNAFMGSIPSGIGLLSNLKHLSLERNSLDSTLPTQLGSLLKLETMNLQDNNLSGPLPSEMGLLTSLAAVNLAGNPFTGRIPSEMGLLTQLRSFTIGKTLLTGSLPPGISSVTLNGTATVVLPQNATHDNIFHHSPNSSSPGGKGPSAAPSFMSMQPITSQPTETPTQRIPPSPSSQSLSPNPSRSLTPTKVPPAENPTKNPSSVFNPNPAWFDQPFFEEEDPWEGLRPEDVAKWNNGGSGGLKLEIINALEDKWHHIFEGVVEDWNTGTPKALQLSIQTMGHDPECEPVENSIKVCNGNYGATQWKGINQVLIQNGHIVGATCKMNEYYLELKPGPQLRYALCHELGHSFGLPHTDEDFFNRDLGNCMDYTNNFAVNMNPDESNFLFLQELYGTIPGSPNSSHSATPTASTNLTQNPSSAHTPHPTSLIQPFFEGEDPWEGLEPRDVVRWNNGGSGGLKLDIINALEDKWHGIFEGVVMDYERGKPQVLQLSMEMAVHDPECQPVADKIKVCNGNYGATQWKGINQVLIQNGYIVASTCKMNEYYLENASEPQMQYTMCHEMGHSFGLPHSDEDYYNLDLGNCMDYTTNPDANRSPDKSNFLFLNDLYGTIPENRELQKTSRHPS